MEYHQAYQMAQEKYQQHYNHTQHFNLEIDCYHEWVHRYVCGNERPLLL